MDDALPMVVLRWLLYAALMTLWGVPLFAWHALTEAEHGGAAGRAFRRLMVWAAGLGLAFAVAGMAWLAKSMIGAAAWADIPASTYAMLVADTAMGWAWQVRMGALLVALVAAMAGLGSVRRAVVMVAGAVALASLAWTGHGAMDSGARGIAHLGADILHLWAAGAWWGALVAFVLLVRAARTNQPASVDVLSRAAHGFAHIGSLVVALLVVTGVINYVMIAGWTWAPLVETRYGHLLLAKLAVFGVMVGLAGMNRYRLSPALLLARQQGDAARAVRLLRRSLLLETSAAGVVLGLVAWLGTISPMP